LRIAFNLSETTIERIRKFRENRISKVLADETPIPLQNTPKIILHIISYASFSPAHNFDLTKVNSWQTKLPPLYKQELHHRFNLDGLLTYSLTPQGKAHSYVQVFKNGIIEAVESSMLGLEQGIPSVLYEPELIRSLNSFLSFNKEIGVELPLFVFLSFLSVKGRILAVSSNRFGNLNAYPIDRDILDLPEVKIESYEQKAQQVLRPQFDSVWNACGYERCFNYDANGNWVGH